MLKGVEPLGSRLSGPHLQPGSCWVAGCQGCGCSDPIYCTAPLFQAQVNISLHQEVRVKTEGRGRPGSLRTRIAP